MTTIPALPASGNTSWYSHYSALDAVARKSTNDVEVPLSSFSGANDDAKLSAFMSWAAAQTYKGITVFLDENRLYQFSTTQNLYNGFSIRGIARPQDQPRSSMPIGQRVDVNVSNNGWFALNQSQTFGCSFQGLSIDGNSTNRLVQGHASNVLWTTTFRDLALQNIQNVLGSTSQKLLMTACTIDGFWNANNLYAPGFVIGGSDNFISPSLMLIDSPPAFRSVSSYLMDFNYMSNTHVKHLYMTAESASGIYISGNNSNGCLWFTDSVIEGRNNTDYCAGALIKQTGGVSVFRDLRLANAMGNPTISGGNNDQGVIHVSGGTLLVSGCIYEKQSSVAESTPFIYATGASTRVRVRNILTYDGTWTGKPVAYQTQAGLIDADNSVTVVTL
jgi:hypothetical protein